MEDHDDGRLRRNKYEPGHPLDRTGLSARARPCLLPIPEETPSPTAQPHPGTGTRRRLRVPQPLPGRLRLGGLRPLLTPGRRSHRRILLPTILCRTTGTNVPAKLLQPVRDPRPATSRTWRAAGIIRREERRRGPADLPVSPYAAETGAKPVTPVPRLNGRSEAAPIASGASGLTP